MFFNLWLEKSFKLTDLQQHEPFSCRLFFWKSSNRQQPGPDGMKSTAKTVWGVLLCATTCRSFDQINQKHPVSQKMLQTSSSTQTWRLSEQTHNYIHQRVNVLSHPISASGQSKMPPWEVQTTWSNTNRDLTDEYNLVSVKKEGNKWQTTPEEPET